LWRMRLRRMEAEIVRDSILATSGRLDRSMGGPPLPLDPRADGTVVLKEDALPTPTSKYRRSMYILARRAYHLSLLDVFDQPILATNCTERGTSAVVNQSLALLNDGFVIDQASAFAERVIAAAGEGPIERRIELAFQIALARPPVPDETSWAVELFARQRDRFLAAGNAAEEADRKALAQVCHMLLNTNEFLYVP
jgi:hypothetical protein